MLFSNFMFFATLLINVIIPPVLAYLTLDGLENVISTHFGKKGTRKRKEYGVHVIRYADDFIVTGKSREILETKVKRLEEDFLSVRGLTLSAEKTHTCRTRV